MKFRSIITAAMALLVSTACNGTKQQQTESSTSNETTAMAKDGKALVVFFSHAGDNYAVVQNSSRSSPTSTTAWPIIR